MSFPRGTLTFPCAAGMVSKGRDDCLPYGAVEPPLVDFVCPCELLKEPYWVGKWVKSVRAVCCRRFTTDVRVTFYFLLISIDPNRGVLFFGILHQY